MNESGYRYKCWCNREERFSLKVAARFNHVKWSFTVKVFLFHVSNHSSIASIPLCAALHHVCCLCHTPFTIWRSPPKNAPTTAHWGFQGSEWDRADTHPGGLVLPVDLSRTVFSLGTAGPDRAGIYLQTWTVVCTRTKSTFIPTDHPFSHRAGYLWRASSASVKC